MKYLWTFALLVCVGQTACYKGFRRSSECGDGRIGVDFEGKPEECDDGNLLDGDDCNSDCRIPGLPGYKPSYSTPSDSSSEPDNPSPALPAFLSKPTFSPLRSVSSTGETWHLTLTDFNTDGNLDVIYTKGTGTLGALCGDGRDFFRENLQYPSPCMPTGSFELNTVTSDVGRDPLLSADLNADKNPDLLTLNRDRTLILLFFGRGDGTLLSEEAIALTGSQPVALATEDLNQDGLADVIVAKSNNMLQPFLTQSKGGALSFTPQAEQSVCQGPTAVVALDLDQDKDIDLVTLCQGASQVTALWSDGKGAYQRTDTKDPAKPSQLIAADFDADQDIDLATLHKDEGSITTLLQKDGTFVVSPQYAMIGGDRTVAFAAGDLNNDDLPDIATSNLEGPSVSLMLNTGGGVFVSYENLRLRASNGPGTSNDIALGDVNKDGALDIVTIPAYAVGLSLSR